MRKPTRWLTRWLPEAAARDWLEPSLHDIDADRVRQQVGAGPLRRSFPNVLAAVRAFLVYAECLRLLVIQRCYAWRHRPTATGPLAVAPKREYAAMFFRDVRHALRLFRREPGFTSAAVLTLALGIGANVALFAVVEAVLLRPLPFADADDLVMLRYRDVRTGISKDFVALGDVIDLRARQRTLDSLVAFNGTLMTLLEGDEPTRVEGISTTPELFTTLRVTPEFGRFFGPEDLREGAPSIVVISHNLWTTRFGSNPDVIGRSINLGDSRRTVVGVLPRGFRFPPNETTDIVVPFRLPPAAPAERRVWIHAMGRVRTTVGLRQANADLASLSRQLEAEFPGSNRGIEYDLLSIREAAVGDTGRPLLLLFVAVGFVLLIACVNVGNLLIARSLSRQQEIAMRLALGAGRMRLAVQTLTEGLVLALAGGVAGVLIAWRAAPALAAMIPQAESIPGLDSISVNPTVLGFTFAASVVAALLFSGVATVGLGGSMASVAASRRTTMTATARRAASMLVVAELAVAVVLLIGPGLTLRSFAKLVSIDPGFRPDHVVNLQIALPGGRQQGQSALRAFFDRAFAAINALPGVEAVGAGVVTPLTGNNWTIPLERPEHPLAKDERAPDVGWQLASGGYFRVLKIPLRAGRLFDERDRGDKVSAVIVSEGLAARYFAGETAVGKRVRLGPADEAEIVGVVGDIRRAALSDSPRADMYLPFEQVSSGEIGLFIRTAGDPLATVPALRTTLRALESNMLIFEVKTMDAVAAQSAAVSRLAMRLLSAFAILDLALAATGIYGVMSYSVRRRTREIGTRLALGASRRDIVILIMRQATVVTMLGVAVGIGFALVASRSLTAILFGVAPWDPMSIASAIAILTMVALAASYLPAHRASRLDPARTLAVE